jgi:import inner membrane translocase subunit TIM44
VFETFAEKAGVTSVFAKLSALRSSGAFKKGSDVLEDIRERWETSDSPLVHKIQDMQEGLFTETEQAEAYRVIRTRQPDFNINGFLAEVRRDVPAVLGAYLKGDSEALQKTNVSKEMLERMGGQMRVWQSEQQFVDPRILHLSELELVEVRMMEGEPLVVLQFSCQQINCVRNKEGEIVDGAEDDIQAVHYLWAMQLSPKDFVATDGREYSAQTWQLREMVLRGMMAVAA